MEKLNIGFCMKLNELDLNMKRIQFGSRNTINSLLRNSDSLTTTQGLKLGFIENGSIYLRWFNYEVFIEMKE